MELIIYLLGILLLPLLIVFKTFKLKDLNRGSKFNFLDKSFGNVSELKLLGKKFQIVLYLLFVSMIGSATNEFDTVYIKVIISFTTVYLIFKNIGSQNDTN